MIKNNKSGKVIVPEGLSEQVGAMIEHFDSRLGFVAEQTGQIMKDIGILKDDVGLLKEGMNIVKDDLETIKYSLKQKVDLDEFKALEHRVALLESQR